MLSPLIAQNCPLRQIDGSFVPEADITKWGYFNQNVTSQPADALSPLIISNFIIFAYFFRDRARLSS